MQNQIEQKLDSREVAEMMEMEHKSLLRKIDGINKDLLAQNCATKKYWEENSFICRGKEFRSFLITKKGCEFLAHKTTGTKGNLFTDKYMDRFSEMEQYIKEDIQQPKKLSAIEQLQLQNQAILEVNEKVDKIQNDMPLFKAECDELQALVKKIGVGLMGGKNALAYKNNSLRGKVYSDIQHQLKREFGVNKYSWIKHSQFQQAKDIILSYKLPIALKKDIQDINGLVYTEINVPSNN
ncbi:MAG: ORF6C domain-containing protein [Inconstantimicrobium porci]|uniref:Rha family transcriptional regulator n=1 Tax=Inconstantimicrobium porci TaxID=2652291 RepID=UPI002A90A70D|nr:ORF6C domain-containing protein [Inconstantimicrobium porci]MDY5910599.1 ORF6C domain-containing protein [Inconstantimicrobium porci]